MLQLLIVSATPENLFSEEAIAGYLATAIITVIGLLVTYFVLKKVLFKPILQVMDQRRTEVDQMFAEAESMQNRANQAKTDAEALLDDAKVKAANIVEEAGVQAVQQKQVILDEAKEEAAEILNRAHHEEKYLSQQREEELQREAVGIAMTALGRLLTTQQNTSSELKQVETIVSDLYQKDIRN